jgi:chaperonin GroES
MTEERERKERLVPSGDKVLVLFDEAEEKLGGIVIPDIAKALPRRGTVVAVGDGNMNDGPMILMPYKVGDRVLFGRHSGAEIKFHWKDEKNYILLRLDDIYGHLIPEEE